MPIEAGVSQGSKRRSANVGSDRDVGIIGATNLTISESVRPAMKKTDLRVLRFADKQCPIEEAVALFAGCLG